MRRFPLVMVLCLVSALCPATARAQPPCSFVLGFAEFASRAGDLIGECVGEQRTLTAPEQVMLVGYGPVALQPGETVQATTHGLLRWNEQRATVEFLGRDGFWQIGDNGLVLTRWETAAIPPGVSAAQTDSTIPEPLKPAWDALVGNSAMVAVGPELEPIGTLMQQTVAVTGVTLQVAPLPAGTSGRYRVSDNSMTINAALTLEDPRALASVLAHELTHARQVHAGRGSRSECVAMEVEAYMTGALVWVSFWPDQAPPTRTALERELTRLAQSAATEGEPGLYRLVVDTPGYQDQCQLWVPEGVAQSSQSSSSTSSGAPPPAPPASKLTPVLASRCANIAFDLTEELAPYLGATPGDAGKFLVGMNSGCRRHAELYGAPGVDCVDQAARALARSVRRGNPSTFAVFEARVAACTAPLRP